MSKLLKHSKLGLLLEAEVPPTAQTRFENRYRKATGLSVSPGNPVNYQDQPNKWGLELRVYFNDNSFAALVESLGVHVEFPRKGYMAGGYRFRFNDNSLWWKLVEVGGLKLGPN